MAVIPNQNILSAVIFGMNVNASRNGSAITQSNPNNAKTAPPPATPSSFTIIQSISNCYLSIHEPTFDMKKNLHREPQIGQHLLGFLIVGLAVIDQSKMVMGLFIALIGTGFAVMTVFTSMAMTDELNHHRRIFQKAGLWQNEVIKKKDLQTKNDKLD